MNKKNLKTSGSILFSNTSQPLFVFKIHANHPLFSKYMSTTLCFQNTCQPLLATHHDVAAMLFIWMIRGDITKLSRGMCGIFDQKVERGGTIADTSPFLKVNKMLNEVQYRKNFSKESKNITRSRRNWVNYLEIT